MASLGGYTAENKAIKVSHDLHRAIRRYAAEHDRQMYEVVEEAWNGYVSRASTENRGGIRENSSEKSERATILYPTGSESEEFSLLRGILESGDAALVEAVRANLREFVRLLRAHEDLAEAKRRLEELERRLAGDPSPSQSRRGDAKSKKRHAS